MLKRLVCLHTDNKDPYRNLAMEQYLTEHVAPGECVLFLWQNEKTVVIGKNQNAWKECNIAALAEDGGHLVRRLSGGGAVYHDADNLNFTFCVCEEDYDVAKQTQVILEAVQSLGIRAEKTGRNDLTVDGQKFSGNAYLKIGDKCYHHGTLLLNVSRPEMVKYLTVDKSKLTSKGVDSVRSRVVGLSELGKEITVAAMREALQQAFSKVYELPCERGREVSMPEEELEVLRRKFASEAWNFGRKIPFEAELSERFSWGNLQMQIHVERGKIRELQIYSDAMDHGAVEDIAAALRGCPYFAKDMVKALSEVTLSEHIVSKDVAQAMKEDVMRLIEENVS